MARSTVCPTVKNWRCCKCMTGVGIEPTTYGLKVRCSAWLSYPVRVCPQLFLALLTSRSPGPPGPRENIAAPQRFATRRMISVGFSSSRSSTRSRSRSSEPPVVRHRTIPANVRVR